MMEPGKKVSWLARCDDSNMKKMEKIAFNIYRIQEAAKILENPGRKIVLVKWKSDLVAPPF